MEGFLREDTSLVMSVERVTHWDKLRLVSGIEREKMRQSSCFQVGDTCGQIWAGWEKRHKQSSNMGFGPRPENRDKIDSVYVGEFAAGEF